MAEVTAKAYSELIHTPLYGQLRILREQKYPKQTDGQFRIPYYQPALRCIRKYYQTNNDPVHLPSNAGGLAGCGTVQSRIDHNLRAVNAFRNGSQFPRPFAPQKVSTLEHTIHGVTIRFTPDLVALESAAQVPKFVMYNCSSQAPEAEIIRTTVELAHYILEQNGVIVPLRQVEYICLDSDTVHRFTTRRAATITRANQTAAAINAMWAGI